MSKEDFDSAIIELAASGGYFPSRDAGPPGILTDAEMAAGSRWCGQVL
jgi:hypothetical protein